MNKEIQIISTRSVSEVLTKRTYFKDPITQKNKGTLKRTLHCPSDWVVDCLSRIFFLRVLDNISALIVHETVVSVFCF